MQASILPISAGFNWILNGWNLFRAQPMHMFMWSIFIGFLINLSYVFLIVGQIVLFVVTPMLTFLTLSACQRIANGEKLSLGTWFNPLRNNKDVRKNLVRIGFIYLVFCLAAAFLSSIPYVGEINQVLDNALTEQTQIDEKLLASVIKKPLITFGILYVLVSALFWHAPALIGWHKIPIKQAMFYSMIACWRNKFAFLIYGACWAAMFYLLNLVALTLAGSGINISFVQMILTPLNLVMVAVLYCSFYPAYQSVFGDSIAASQNINIVENDYGNAANDVNVVINEEQINDDNEYKLGYENKDLNTKDVKGDSQQDNIQQNNNPHNSSGYNDNESNYNKDSNNKAD